MQHFLQRLVIIVIIAAGIVTAPFLGSQVTQGDFLIVVVLAALFFIILFLSQDIQIQWIYIPVAYGVQGTINLLPLNFTLFEISIILVTSHYVVARMVFRKQWISIGDLVSFASIVLVMMVIFYHWFEQGIGFRVLGGESVGARKNFSILLGAAAYVIIVSLCKDQWKLLNRLPFLYFLAWLGTMVPFLLTTYFPVTTPYIFRVIGMVNVEAYKQEFLGGETLGRIGQLGGFANAMLLWLVSAYPVRNWWRPEKWWVLVCGILALYLCIRSGFRNALFTFVLISTIAAYCSIGWRSLYLGIVAAVVLLGLALGQGTLYNLPPAMQRTLSFLPGDWDEEVKHSAASSNDFRATIQGIYMEEYAHKHPLTGGGFNYDAKEVAGINNYEAWDSDPYNQHKGFIIRKDYHIGWISLYDTVGIIGGVGFIMLFLCAMRNIWLSMRLTVGPDLSPILMWVTAILVSSFITFFAVFGAFQTSMPLMCMLAALAYVVRVHLEKLNAPVAVASAPVPDGKPAVDVSHA